MTTLNRDAADVMIRNRVRAATDVTGYGLLGHLRSMMRASGCSAVVRSSAVPIITGALPRTSGRSAPVP
jgi:selenide,water dikinase